MGLVCEDGVVKVKVSKTIEALRKAKGLKTEAIKILGITLSDLNGMIEKSKKIRDALDLIEEEKLDRAKKKLLEAVEEKKVSAIKCYIEMHDKQRIAKEVGNAGGAGNEGFKVKIWKASDVEKKK